MSATQVFHFPVPPSMNTYWRMVGRKVLLSRPGRQYKERAYYLAIAQGATLIRAPQDICVSVKWYRTAKRGDVDNRLKPLLDALQGAVYQNDSQIARVEIERDDSDPTHGRVEVTVTVR